MTNIEWRHMLFPFQHELMGEGNPQSTKASFLLLKGGKSLAVIFVDVRDECLDRTVTALPVQASALIDKISERETAIIISRSRCVSWYGMIYTQVVVLTNCV